jgi:hypothetical protein
VRLLQACEVDEMITQKDLKSDLDVMVDNVGVLQHEKKYLLLSLVEELCEQLKIEFFISKASMFHIDFVIQRIDSVFGVEDKK